MIADAIALRDVAVVIIVAVLVANTHCSLLVNKCFSIWFVDFILFSFCATCFQIVVFSSASFRTI